MVCDSLRRWYNNHEPTIRCIAKVVGFVLVIGVGMFIEDYRKSGQERQECLSNKTMLEGCCSSLTIETSEQRMTIKFQNEKIAELHSKHLKTEQELKLKEEEIKLLQAAKSQLVAESEKLKEKVKWLDFPRMWYILLGAVFTILVLFSIGALLAACETSS